MRPRVQMPRLSQFGVFFLLIGAVAAFVGLAPFAGADPVLPEAGSRSAADTISDYQASGFSVNVNYPQGRPNVPLTECMVSAVRNFNGPMASLMMLSAVDVDVQCPNAKQAPPYQRRDRLPALAQSGKQVVFIGMQPDENHGNGGDLGAAIDARAGRFDRLPELSIHQPSGFVNWQDWGLIR